MQLTGPEIRTLRQRLGWSVAELARQMGCSTETVSQWESGHSLPELDALNQLTYLQSRVDQNSERIQHAPVAETCMENRGLAQLNHHDLIKDN